MRLRHYLVILGFLVALYALYLGTPWHWWFEDDTVLMARARDAANPLKYFYHQATHKLAVTGNELAPLLMASFTIDQLVSPKSPTFAYLHSTVVLLGVVLGLFFLAARTFGSRVWALGFVGAWLLLPSTVAAYEFLSARHYLMGMGLASASVLLALAALDRPSSRRISWILASSVAAFLACVAKEFFPTALPVVLVLLYARKRCWSGVGATFLVAASYAFYRLWMVGAGASLDYGIAQPSAAQFGELILRLPYLLAGGWGGYALVAALAALVAHGLARPQLGLRFPLLFVGSVLVVSVLTIYPVGDALLAAWETHGTWVRTPFVINTLVVGLLFYLVAKLKKRWLTVLTLAASFGILVAGTGRTRREWNELKRTNEQEGRAIIDQQEAAVYVRNPAWWYMIGVGRLYRDQPHALYIQAHRATDDDQKVAREAKVLLRYSGGRMISDPALKERLAAGLR